MSTGSHSPHQEEPMQPLFARAFVVALLAALLSVAWLPNKAFYTRGEPREALVAQSMFDSGNWILPSGYGGAVPSKPPFTHWLMALSSIPVGEVTEVTVRFPAALAFTLFMPLFYWFLARRIGERRALGASLILLVSLFWVRGAISARVDTVLAVTTAGALLALYGWYERRLAGFPFAAFLLLSCAFLTKGPIGLALPGAIFGGFLLIREYSLVQIVKRMLVVSVPVVLVSTSWYLLAYLTAGDRFLDKVYYENVARLTGTMEDEPHKHSAFYLYATLLLGFLPWSVALLFSVAPALGRSVKTLRSSDGRGMIRSSLAYLRALPPPDLYAALVCAGYLVFFSIPSSKRGEYLLPMYPFGALLLSGWLTRERWPAREGTIGPRCLDVVNVILSAALVVLTIVMGALAAGVVPANLMHGRRAAQLEFVRESLLALPDLGPQWWLSFAPAGVAIWYLLTRRRAAHSLLTRSFVLYFGLFLGAQAALTQAFTNPLSERQFASEIAAAVPQDGVVRSFGSEFYGTSFYLHRPLATVQPADLRAGEYVVCFEQEVDRLRKELPASLAVEQVLRSSHGVLDPLKRAVLLRVSGTAVREQGESQNG